MTGQTISETVDKFYDLLNSIESEHNALFDAIGVINKEQQDLLHEIELSPLSASELVIVAGKIKEMRKRRRQLYDEMQFVREIRDFAAKYKAWLNPLYLLNVSLYRAEKSQTGRTYTPRVRTDIKLYDGKLIGEEVTE